MSLRGERVGECLEFSGGAIAGGLCGNKFARGVNGPRGKLYAAQRIGIA
jgi:hypothetical protein